MFSGDLLQLQVTAGVSLGSQEAWVEVGVKKSKTGLSGELALDGNPGEWVSKARRNPICVEFGNRSQQPRVAS